jgi:hypothetical protein
MPLYACCWFFFGFGLTAFINSCLLYRYVNPASWRYRHNPDAPSEAFPRNHHMPSEHCFCVKNLLPVPWIYWKPLPLHTPLQTHCIAEFPRNISRTHNCKPKIHCTFPHSVVQTITQ